MSKDILHYLSPRDADKIEYWASDLGPLIERNPRLRDVDLIVEGGVVFFVVKLRSDEDKRS